MISTNGSIQQFKQLMKMIIREICLKWISIKTNWKKECYKEKNKKKIQLLFILKMIKNF